MVINRITPLLLFIHLFTNVVSAKTFSKYGVSLTFPGDYTKSGDIGNESIKVKNVIAETYSLQRDFDAFMITFLRFGEKPKGTLETGMKGAVNAVSGTLTGARYLNINGYAVLEYEYTSSKHGPTLDYFDKVFYLEEYILVNVKYIGTDETYQDKGKMFLESLGIKP